MGSSGRRTTYDSNALEACSPPDADYDYVAIQRQYMYFPATAMCTNDGDAAQRYLGHTELRVGVATRQDATALEPGCYALLRR